MPQANRRDAALLGLFRPGAYTVVFTGEGGSDGEALVEAYDVPPTKL